MKSPAVVINNLTTQEIKAELQDDDTTCNGCNELRCCVVVSNIALCHGCLISLASLINNQSQAKPRMRVENANAK